MTDCIHSGRFFRNQPNGIAGIAGTEIHGANDYLHGLAMDSEAEILADEFGIPISTAVAICHRFRSQEHQARWETAAPIVTDVIQLLILESRNLKAKVWGLVFSWGLADVANGNKTLGIASMSDEAKRQGCSRALLSHEKRTWDKLFGVYGRVFGKSPEACESNRRARLRVLARGKAT